MLNIDQVQLLESKVEKAVNLIKSLSDNNNSLKKEIEVKNKRISELENLILVFKDDQTKIEQGIVNALNKLSAFENSEYVHKVKNPENNSKESGQLSSAESIQPAVAETKNAEEKQTEDHTQETLVEDAPVNMERQPENEPVVQQAQEDAAEADGMQKDLDYVLGENSGNENQLDIF